MPRLLAPTRQDATSTCPNAARCRVYSPQRGKMPRLLAPTRQDAASTRPNAARCRVYETARIPTGTLQSTTQPCPSCFDISSTARSLSSNTRKADPRGSGTGRYGLPSFTAERRAAFTRWTMTSRKRCEIFPAYRKSSTKSQCRSASRCFSCFSTAWHCKTPEILSRSVTTMISPTSSHSRGNGPALEFRHADR